ncbi:MAG: DHHW family protein [Acutalibacteraceae bacterium]
MDKKGKYIISIIFIISIAVMSVLLFVLPKKTFSHTEKRNLASPPKFSFSALKSGDYTDSWESYINDHLPFREVITGISSYANLALGNNGADGVYNCKDGYLINTPVDRENHLDINMDTISAFAKNTHIPVTMITVPSSGYVLEEKLPKNHLSYCDDRYFEKISTICKNSKIDFVDLRKAFKENKDTTLYYKTDHHWTSSGAYLAYSILGQSLSYTPYSKNDYDVKTYNEFYGTTYSTSAFWLNESDSIETYISKKNTFKVSISENGSTETFDSVFFTDRLVEEDKFPVFLNGNHPFTSIKNNNGGNGQKLLIIKDSFAHTLAPFLADNFAQVDLVDMRYYKNSISEKCKEEKYDKILICYGIDNLCNDTDIVWLE